MIGTVLWVVLFAVRQSGGVNLFKVLTEKGKLEGQMDGKHYNKKAEHINVKAVKDADHLTRTIRASQMKLRPGPATGGRGERERRGSKELSTSESAADSERDGQGAREVEADAELKAGGEREKNMAKVEGKVISGAAVAVGGLATPVSWELLPQEQQMQGRGDDADGDGCQVQEVSPPETAAAGQHHAAAVETAGVSHHRYAVSVGGTDTTDRSPRSKQGGVIVGVGVGVACERKPQQQQRRASTSSNSSSTCYRPRRSARPAHPPPRPPTPQPEPIHDHDRTRSRRQQPHEGASHDTFADSSVNNHRAISSF
eukprot:g5617.t1